MASVPNATALTWRVARWLKWDRQLALSLPSPLASLGTQLTLRTFHTGGVAAGGDITTGLPRVEELFESRKQPKGEAVVAEIKGTVRIIQSDKYADMRLVRVEQC